MKGKCAFASFLCLGVLLFSCSAQKLNITVKNNSVNPRTPQVFYWVNNNTGAEIKNIEWSLNGVYYYTSDLPIGGDHLDLFDFAKPDGTRYDYFSVKPIELKAKCSNGRYSVRFDDIPLPDYFPKPIIPPVGEYKEIERLDWATGFTAENKTSDGVSVSLDVAFGCKHDDKQSLTEIENYKVVIEDFLRRFIAKKSADDFSPYNEENVRAEIKNSVNDSILASGRVRDVRFMDINIGR